MTRLRLAALVAALGGVALAAAPALAAKVKHRVHAAHGPARIAAARPSDFPRYIDTGTDYNPGGDNLYFSDTKYPRYELGPNVFQKFENQ